jgi:aryl-alcohol dehydrogenase-like predicted oxidoreductase
MSNLLKSWSNLPFAFGGASVSEEGGGYGFGKCIEPAREIIDYAVSNGVTVFDTAPIYGFGTSEINLGNALKDVREKVKIISKSGVHWHENKRVDMSNDPKVTQLMLEDSLRRLNSEYIDLYMIHWPDDKVDIRFTLEVLTKAQHEGKIKHIGLCNTNIEDYTKALEVAKIDVIQSELSVFNHSVNEWAENFIEECSFMSWGTFDKGILTGRVSKEREQAKNYDESDCRKSAPWWNQKDVLAKVDKVKSLNQLWNEKDLTLLEGALSFNLSHDFCDMALMGAKSIKDWDTILNAKLTNFSHDTLNKIYELS